MCCKPRIPCTPKVRNPRVSRLGFTLLWRLNCGTSGIINKRNKKLKKTDTTKTTKWSGFGGVGPYCVCCKPHVPCAPKVRNPQVFQLDFTLLWRINCGTSGIIKNNKVKKIDTAKTTKWNVCGDIGPYCVYCKPHIPCAPNERNDAAIFVALMYK